MKALSIKQPYLDWIKSGKKTLEIRSWKTYYRGKLLLCSSKVPERFIANKSHILGHALCVVELKDVYKFEPQHANRAKCNWRDNLYAWELEFIKSVEPFPVKGKLGLFKIDNIPVAHF